MCLSLKNWLPAAISATRKSLIWRLCGCPFLPSNRSSERERFATCVRLRRGPVTAFGKRLRSVCGERHDELVEWHGSLDGLGRVERSDRKRRSVCLRFVEGLGAWRFTGHLELSNLVRKPVGRSPWRSVGHLKVKMQHD